MGLDVRYAERIVLKDCKYDPDLGCMDHYIGWIHPVFPIQSQGIELDRCYAFEGETGSFRAGSYGGYGAWRSELCRAALGVDPETVWDHPGGYVEAPFYLLINYSDCEGWIGPVASAMLARDFADYADRVRPILASHSEYYAERYDLWAHAFAVAAGEGAVMLW